MTIPRALLFAKVRIHRDAKIWSEQEGGEILAGSGAEILNFGIL